MVTAELKAVHTTKKQKTSALDAIATQYESDSDNDEPKSCDNGGCILGQAWRTDESVAINQDKVFCSPECGAFTWRQYCGRVSAFTKRGHSGIGDLHTWWGSL